jgi:hypothetical protein
MYQCLRDINYVYLCFLPEHAKEIAPFLIFMTLSSYHRLIKEKRGVIVTDSRTSEVKSSFIPNEV